MNLEAYRRAREERLAQETVYRPRCLQCRKPEATCYCAHLDPFESHPQFVILIQREEAKRSIATGRMAHLCLSNSLLLEGLDFTADERVNAILQDPRNYPVVLYPGPQAVNLTNLGNADRKGLCPPDKRLVIFVLDATWGQAKRIKRLSRNLSSLPLVCFTPPSLSRFLVRKQPKANCYSTIESIHHVIDLLGESRGGRHDRMLELFGQMVDRQMVYEEKFGRYRGYVSVRGERARVISP